MSIRSFFEADNTAKKPAMSLHSYHRFAAAGFLMSAFTFLGMGMINKHNFVVMIVLLVLAADTRCQVFQHDQGTHHTAG